MAKKNVTPTLPSLPENLEKRGAHVETDGGFTVAKLQDGTTLAVFMAGEWFAKPGMSGRPKQQREVLASEVVFQEGKPTLIETVNVIGEGKRAGIHTYVRPLSENTRKKGGEGEPYDEIVEDNGKEYGVIAPGSIIDASTMAAVFQRHAKLYE